MAKRIRHGISVNYAYCMHHTLVDMSFFMPTRHRAPALLLRMLSGTAHVDVLQVGCCLFWMRPCMTARQAWAMSWHHRPQPLPHLSHLHTIPACTRSKLLQMPCLIWCFHNKPGTACCWDITVSVRRTRFVDPGQGIHIMWFKAFRTRDVSALSALMYSSLTRKWMLLQNCRQVYLTVSCFNKSNHLLIL